MEVADIESKSEACGIENVSQKIGSSKWNEKIQCEKKAKKTMTKKAAYIYSHVDKEKKARTQYVVKREEEEGKKSIRTNTSVLLNKWISSVLNSWIYLMLRVTLSIGKFHLKIRIFQIN